MKNPLSPSAHTMPLSSNPATTGSPLYAAGGTSMEKPKLIQDLGTMYPTAKSTEKAHYGIFECSLCGKHFKTQLLSIKNGNTKSCGCLAKIVGAKRFYKHGMSRTKIYLKWKDFCWRTTKSKKPKDIKNYQQRGITVCPEWFNNFMAFYTWAISNGYSDDMEKIRGQRIAINRINNDGNYEPTNCEFTTYFINAQNTRLIVANNTSGYRGVSWSNVSHKWMADIQWNNKHYYLGLFDVKEDAARAYNNFVIKNKTHHPLNNLPDWYNHE